MLLSRVFHFCLHVLNFPRYVLWKKSRFLQEVSLIASFLTIKLLQRDSLKIVISFESQIVGFIGK